MPGVSAAARRTEAVQAETSASATRTEAKCVVEVGMFQARLECHASATDEQTQVARMLTTESVAKVIDKGDHKGEGQVVQ
jgi:hypothetical protein